MGEPALFLCNGARPAGPEWAAAEVIDYGREDSAINLDPAAFDGLVSHIAQAPVRARVRDLLDIAAFVYAADCRVARTERPSKSKPDTFGQSWRRRLCFAIAARDRDFWSSEKVLSVLTELLEFVSEDTCSFEFTHMPTSAEQTLLLQDSDLPPTGDVILFSGGLDSLAGAIEELSQNRRVCLVSHVSSKKTGATQTSLTRSLRELYGYDRVRHVSVGLDVNTKWRNESTHRTRSFLFAAIASAVAVGDRRNECFFFENGTVSLNLPIAAAVAGSRATRTTHPRTLAALSQLVGLVAGTPFQFRNPFFELTKADVVRVFERRAATDLIGRSRSCAKPMFASAKRPHCGQCSQCIDRRFAVLAAGMEAHDPQSKYKIELLLGERPRSTDTRTAIAYLETARTILDLDLEAFFTHYPEAMRVLDFLDRPPAAAARTVYQLYRRHARAVMDVMIGAIRRHAADIAEHRLHKTCLLQRWQSQEAGSVAPADTSSTDQELANPPQPPFEMWFAPASLLDTKCDVVEVGIFKGAAARMLFVLANRLDQDRSKRQEPSFVLTTDLAAALGNMSEEQVRKVAQRARGRYSNYLRAKGAPEPDLNDFIENLPGRGYRLNPAAIGTIVVAPQTSSQSRNSRIED